MRVEPCSIVDKSHGHAYYYSCRIFAGFKFADPLVNQIKTSQRISRYTVVAIVDIGGGTGEFAHKIWKLANLTNPVYTVCRPRTKNVCGG